MTFQTFKHQILNPLQTENPQLKDTDFLIRLKTVCLDKLFLVSHGVEPTGNSRGEPAA